MKIYQPKFDQLWKKIVGIELYAKENKEYIFLLIFIPRSLLECLFQRKEEEMIVGGRKIL